MTKVYPIPTKKPKKIIVTRIKDPKLKKILEKRLEEDWDQLVELAKH
ncbi:MAG: hypothetical protein ABH821_04995 [archaeon]